MSFSTRARRENAPTGGGGPVSRLFLRPHDSGSARSSWRAPWRNIKVDIEFDRLPDHRRMSRCTALHNSTPSPESVRADLRGRIGWRLFGASSLVRGHMEGRPSGSAEAELGAPPPMRGVDSLWAGSQYRRRPQHSLSPRRGAPGCRRVTSSSMGGRSPTVRVPGCEVDVVVRKHLWPVGHPTGTPDEYVLRGGTFHP